jgi:hypothetical protein
MNGESGAIPWKIIKKEHPLIDRLEHLEKKKVQDAPLSMQLAQVTASTYMCKWRYVRPHR